MFKEYKAVTIEAQVRQVSRSSNPTLEPICSHNFEGVIIHSDATIKSQDADVSSLDTIVRNVSGEMQNSMISYCQAPLAAELKSC